MTNCAGQYSVLGLDYLLFCASKQYCAALDFILVIEFILVNSIRKRLAAKISCEKTGYKAA